MTPSSRREPRPAGFVHPFLEAAQGRAPSRPPVWIMRQAGRYLPDYRRVRKLFPNFLDFCRSPEHVAEVTVQPVDQIGVDAAILFSDILVLLPPLGLKLEFIEGKGPVVHNPVRDAAAIDALPGRDVNGELNYVFQGIQLTLRDLAGYAPLIGFAGGPFTVASYMVEGGSSKELAKLKGLMFSNPAAYHRLLEKLVNITGAYLCEQIRQGVHAVTLMDSWAGCLGPEDYREFVFPHTRAVIARVKAQFPDVPFIHYANGAHALIDDFIHLGVEVVGLDWRTGLSQVFKAHPDQVFQGNLDPCYLFASPEKIAGRVHEMKAVVGRRPHIWNLGHGILPDTPVENARAFVDAVHGGL
jgi:uroporphyrinogen decarboxylase